MTTYHLQKGTDNRLYTVEPARLPEFRRDVQRYHGRLSRTFRKKYGHQSLSLAQPMRSADRTGTFAIFSGASRFDLNTPQWPHSIPVQEAARRIMGLHEERNN